MDELTWKSWLSRFSWDHPYLVFVVVLFLTVGAVALFPRIRMNTDPEDMLRDDHPARVEDRRLKENFYIHDMVAVALEPPECDEEITTERMELLHNLVRKIRRQEGVISEDILSVFTSDDIEGFPGGIDVDRFLRSPPEDQQGVNQVIERLQAHPVLSDMIVDETTCGLAIFVPIRDKDYSYPLRQAVLDFWDQQPEEAGKIHIAGLPVAEETFGVQMFYQMATSAPLAFLLIGIIMLIFFRSFSLVTWALFQAAIVVIWVMGALIGLGYTVHIMSTMIPIFLLPVAVVDSIHILSDFTDRLNISNAADREVMAEVYEEIFYPILFTSLTSAAGFFSLSMTGIPPVQVFGVAVGAGILLAFLTTLTILPAGTNLWAPSPKTSGADSFIGRLVSCCEDCSCIMRRYPKIILLLGLIVVGLGIYGMTLIEVNDNPTRWFMSGHPIREADRFINRAFAGSYPAYMVLESETDWYGPEQMEQLAELRRRLEGIPNVGKVTSVDGIVNKIHYELHDGQIETEFPDSSQAVQQYLFLFENSGNPQDLFRLITSDGEAINVWFNLESGDNQDMALVMEEAERYVEQAGFNLREEPRWGGITVVNLIWQNVMVTGMAWALVSSYVAIFLMMLLLYRNLRWTLMSLVPLTFTLIAVYGLVGWVGKDYDMPVAVLSALSIGIAVDFAIHFIQRGRQIIKAEGSWPAARERLMGEPARAIARNGVVIALGFTPLLVAPLVPYVTVGVFMVLIMSFAGLSTLVGLFALFEVFHPFLPDET